MWYPGVVGTTGEDGRTKIVYDGGDVENVVLEEEKYRVFPSENEEEHPQQQVTATPWKTVLLRHWTEKLGNNQHSNTAAAMQAAALEKSTADNYEAHWKKFVKFCTEENLRWLPATTATVQLYMAALQNQIATAEQQNFTETVRTYLPASAVRPQTAMLRESVLRDNNRLSIVLEKEKGKNHLLCKRRLCIPWGGVAKLHELLDRWEQTRDEDRLPAASTSTAKAADTASYWRLLCDKKKQFKNVDANEWIACALGHAAPCLRSRLDLGVAATALHLSQVERAEAAVRDLLRLGPIDNLRVRVFQSGEAVVEVDTQYVQSAQASEEHLRRELHNVGLSLFAIHKFRSGALSMFRGEDMDNS
ncbi:hypothetical protein CYMTET_54126 [Cymbomonas tetramitiformis]|uniref:Core-binding (CB) domain-containing protein n=1 Tax=Cymbomonas tetramitiformis TaxID=36881 RepID=A0AAE0BGY7_9CHLO|nr:hypothetical protein CYMTET_54126 [Cymbomonas tetramitiformis]